MPAELAGGLAAIALFAVPGYGLTELFPGLRRLPAVRRAGYGYLLGVASVAGSLYGLSHCFGVPLRPAAIWTVVALPAAAGLVARVARWRQNRRPEAGGAAGLSGMSGGLAARVRRLGGPAAVAALAMTAVVCLAVFAEAVSDPVNDWDGRMTWGAQARYVRQAGTVDAAALREGWWYVTHPQYPLLLPVAQVAVLEALGADADAPRMRAVYAAFLPALLLVVYDGACRGAGRRAAALAVLFIAVTPYMLLGTGGAATTYSDLPLAAFYGASLVLLLGPRPSAGGGLAAGLLLAAAALAKNEGAPLALLALALGWRGGRLRGREAGGAASGAAGDRAAAARIRRLVAAAAPLALALALLGSWRASIPNRMDDAYPALLVSGHLAARVAANVAAAVPIVLDRMMRLDHWSGFWWMAPAVLLAGRRALRHPLNRRLLLAAAAPPALALAAYAVHPQAAELAAVTWERFLLQGSVPGLIMLAGALSETWRPWRRRAPAPEP
jgi:hypothetical protein